MVAKIYRNKSDKKVLNKEIELVKEINVNLLSNTDFLNPHLKISNINIEDLGDVNYIHIPDFNRYYYIDNIEMLVGGNVGLTCSVDVLMSHKEEILNIKTTIKRAENMKNGYILDDEYKSLSYSQIVTKRFPNEMTNDSFILMTVG